MEALSAPMLTACPHRSTAVLMPAASAPSRRGPLQRQRLSVPIQCSLSSQASKAVQATLLRRDSKRQRTSVIALISEAVSVNVSGPFSRCDNQGLRAINLAISIPSHTRNSCIGHPYT